jgi:hypothetical protein
MSHSSSAIEDLFSPSDDCPTVSGSGQPECHTLGVTDQEALDNIADAQRDRQEVVDAPATSYHEEAGLDDDEDDDDEE